MIEPAVALRRGVRQPGVEREHRHFDGEAEEEADEDPELKRRWDQVSDLWYCRTENVARCRGL